MGALSISLVFIFFFSVLPPKSVGSSSESYVLMIDGKKMVLGSQPPGCENKCNTCRPCMAAVVVPEHRQMKAAFEASSSASSESREEEDTYYLLSWKCRCGNKIFHP